MQQVGTVRSSSARLGSARQSPGAGVSSRSAASRIRAGLVLFLCLALGSYSVPTAAPAKQVLSVSDIENVCRFAADDAKQFLRVAEEEGKRYRGSLKVCVLGVRNLSEAWHFSPDPSQESERLHGLALKLGRAFAAPGRIRTEIFTADTPSPADALGRTLREMLTHPATKWIDDATRIGSNVGWVVYGYLLDIPGRERPYVVLKMTAVKDRLLVWGGCFSTHPREPGHQRHLYPRCREIAAALDVPTWAKPEVGAFMPSTYWLPPGAPGQDARSEEDVFADLLVIEFLRVRTLRPEARWIDPFLVKNFAAEQRESASERPASEGVKGLDYGILGTLHAAAEWQRLNCFITGTVELARPRVSSALLKCLQLVSPSAEPGTCPDAYVLSGYCSPEKDYAGRRAWVRKTVDLTPQTLRREVRVLRVLDSAAFEDRESFRDLVEMAIAQPEIMRWRVLERQCPTQTADYGVLTLTDESRPARALYLYLVDLKSGRLLWARNQPRPGVSPPDASYREYCAKVQRAVREGASDYGQCPALIWQLGGGTGDRRTGRWSDMTVGQELAVGLIDPSRPFVYSVGARVFGVGDYAGLLTAAATLKTQLTEPVKAIVFQLLDRGQEQRPALVAKYLDPATGRIDWAYYDEPPGSPVCVAEEEDLLGKIRSAVQGLQKAPAPAQATTSGTVVVGFRDHGLLSLGRRPYEMVVTQMAVRRSRPPLEWRYVVARIPELAQAGPEGVFSETFRTALADEGVASAIQAEWLPANVGVGPQQGLGARQLCLWETALSQLKVERAAASPPPSTIPLPGQHEQSLGVAFLYQLAATVMDGARNSQEWEGLADLRERVPLAADVLRIALGDYSDDAGLTQNIVIRFGEATVVSTGVDDASVTAGRGLLGLLSDPVLSGADPNTFFICLQGVGFDVTSAVEAREGATAVGRLYPPDWRETYPDGRALLDMPAGTAASVLQRNTEYLIRQARFALLDPAALARRYQPGAAGAAAAAPADILRRHGGTLQQSTARLCLRLRDLRAFVLEAPDGTPCLVHSLTVRPTAQLVYPNHQLLGSLPDAFRFFVIQSMPPGTPAAATVTGLARNQLKQGVADDVTAVSQLWAHGDHVEARALRRRVLRDLATWQSALSITRETVAAAAVQLADAAVRLEIAYIAERRGSVASAAGGEVLEQTWSDAIELLADLASWETLHSVLAGRADAACREIAERLVAVHSEVAGQQLERVTAGADVHSVAEADRALDHARFVTDAAISAVVALEQARPGPLSSPRVRAAVAASVARLVSATKDRANTLFPQQNELKRKEKALRQAVLESLQASVQRCSADLQSWGEAFDEVARLAQREAVRTPDWNRRDWRKSKSVPAQTLADAAAALADELKRL